MYIAISVLVAACIGGMTNYLAIKMIFRPLNEKRIGRMRIPFTPGLIPKRRADIARSLGEVVASYLVTAESLSELLQQPSFKARWVDKFREWFMAMVSKEETVHELATHYWASQWESLGQLVIRDVVPGWNEENKQKWASLGASYLISEITKELQSPEGFAMLRQWLDRLPEQMGGVFGSLAGLFMDKGQMAVKVQGIVIQRLLSPQTKQMLDAFIVRKLDEWGGVSLNDVLDRTVGTLKLSDLINESWQANMMASAPKLIDSVMHFVATHVKRIIAAIDLPRLVETQVSQFPMEQLEQVVLGITGRELKAITWFGALIGGLIGLFQAILVRWFI